MKKKAFGLLFFVSLLSLFTPAVILAQDLADSLAQVKEAIRSERYEKALSLLERLKSDYPSEPAPFALSGDLFSEKGLYNLALQDYQRAAALVPDDFDYLSALAETYGRLDRNRESVEVLERLVLLYPGNSSTVSDLGWMYFKTFRLEEGIALLEKALAHDEREYGYMMTLGTLYAAHYDFKNSEKNYLASIEAARKEGDTYFASVAHYNLCILYHDFYQYGKAMQEAENSLANRERSGGHLLRGELFQTRMNYRRALAEFEAALESDDTPLTKLNFAYLYQSFGNPQAALHYVEEVESEADSSWMYSYGITRTKLALNLHELKNWIYRDLSAVKRRTPARNPLDWLRLRGGALVASVRSVYHDFQFRRYSWDLADELLEESNLREGWWHRYQTLRGYGLPAETYLARVKEFDLALDLPAEPFFLLEEGRESRDHRLLLQAAAGFDPLWEKEALSETLQLLFREHSGQLDKQTRNTLIVQLYEFNPGGVRASGARLPLKLSLQGWSWWERLRWKGLLKTGFSLSSAEEAYELVLAKRPTGETGFTLKSSKGRILLSDTMDSSDIGLQAQALVERLYLSD